MGGDADVYAEKVIIYGVVEILSFSNEQKTVKRINNENITKFCVTILQVSLPFLLLLLGVVSRPLKPRHSCTVTGS